MVDFPSNFGGYILHKGRSGVAAAAEHHRASPYATVRSESHFMGVVGGATIWDALVRRFGDAAGAAPEDLSAQLNEYLAVPVGEGPAAGADVPGALAAYAWRPDLLSRSTPECVVVMRPFDTHPTILSGTARLCWEIFQVPTSRSEAVQLVADVMVVESSAVESEIADFQVAMLNAGLLVSAAN